nr:hypothetical protein [Tanacetum cinerariifolium]
MGGDGGEDGVDGVGFAVVWWWGWQQRLMEVVAAVEWGRRGGAYDGRSTYYGGIATCTHRGLCRGNCGPPLILAEQFELKHSLINMMTSDQFFGLEKDNPHDHIRVARRWLEKELPCSILTWEDLVSKFINELFPPLRTTNLRNEISNFQQRFNESFHEAWDRYKDLLRACPHHGFIELHQLDTFYNALNPADQDSLNSAEGGNLLERRTQDVLTIIENKSKIAKLTHAVNQQTSVVIIAMTAILKQFQATPPPASIKAVEEIYVTCGGSHPYYQCLAAGGNTFLELRDNIQGYVAAAAVNINQDQSYQAPTQQNQVVPLSELEKVKRMNEASMKAIQTQINNVKNELRNETKNSIQSSMSNQTNELKNIMASFFQMNTASTSGSGHLPSNTIVNPKGELKAITTRRGIVLDVPFVPIPLSFINPEEDERVEETLTDQDLAEYTIKVPPSLVQKSNLPSQRNFVLHINITLADALILIPKYQKMLKAFLSNKEKLLELENIPLNENCSTVILKKLPEKLGDPGKFLILCGFSLPDLISTRMTLELANRAICTSAEIARDVFVLVGKFTFPVDFVIVDYESDPRVPLILGRHFLRTAHVLIDDHREEMILRDEGGNVLIEKLLDLDSTKDPREKLLNINLLLAKIKFLNDNHIPDHMFKPLSPSPIPVEDSDSFFNPEGGNVLIEKLLVLDSTKDPREKLLNINLLLAKIKFLNDNHTPDHMFKPLSPSPIPVEDIDSFLEKSDTSLTYLDISLPEFETFINHTEEMNSGSTTTHADYSLPKYDSFLFEIDPDQGKLTSVVSLEKSNKNVIGLQILTSYQSMSVLLL